MGPRTRTNYSMIALAKNWATTQSRKTAHILCKTCKNLEFALFTNKTALSVRQTASEIRYSARFTRKKFETKPRKQKNKNINLNRSLHKIKTFCATSTPRKAAKAQTRSVSIRVGHTRTSIAFLEIQTVFARRNKCKRQEFADMLKMVTMYAKIKISKADFSADTVISNSSVAPMRKK